MANSKCRNAILDSGVLIVLVIVLSISAVIGYNIFGDLNTDIQADSSLSQATKDTSGNLFSIYPKLMDNLFLMAFVLFIVFLVVSVFLLDTHPIFFIITIILIVSMFLVAMLLSNVYEELMEDTELSASANNFPYMSWVNDHLVEMIIGVAFLISILLFLKFKG